MIKILQLTRNLGIGGLEKVVYDLCKGIDKTQFQISVCCLHFKGEFGEALEKMGIRVHTLPTSTQVDYFSFLKVARVIRSLKPDILHTHNSHAFIDGTLAALISGRPKVVNTDHARNYPDKKRILIAERICAKLADKIVAVSDHTRNELAEYSRIPKTKIEIIFNGIDSSKYAIRIDKDAKRSELGIGRVFPVIGLGVRLTDQKGISYLLDAMPKLIQRFPKIILLIAGKGALDQELRSRSDNLGLSEHVRFLGARLDWNELLSLIDVYVLPSVWEGLPLALLEAMAAKKAIVATDVGGVPSVIRHNENGLLVPPRDSDSLANAIARIVENRNMAAKLSENAQNTFFNGFTVEKMVKSYEQLYYQMLEGKGPKYDRKS
jgi:glycosyltransferase involved in cell wall biosynthesis